MLHINFIPHSNTQNPGTSSAPKHLTKDSPKCNFYPNTWLQPIGSDLTVVTFTPHYSPHCYSVAVFNPHLCLPGPCSSLLPGLCFCLMFTRSASSAARSLPLPEPAPPQYCTLSGHLRTVDLIDGLAKGRPFSSIKLWQAPCGLSLQGAATHVLASDSLGTGTPASLLDSGEIQESKTSLDLLQAIAAAGVR